MSEHVKEVSDSSFEKDVLSSGMLAPTVEAVAEHYGENASVVKLNVDDNPSTAQRYGIKGIPTLILFRDGKEVERVVGATSKESITRMIEKYVSAAA
jgi:thioredoxin 1